MSETKKVGDRFVANGGWVKRKFYGRPRTRLFTFLSVGWIVVSAPALFIVFRDSSRWIDPPTLSGKLGGIAFEQWVGIALILVHVVFVALAVRFHLTEQPHEEVFLEDNPDTDSHKLY
ncbi:MAG: hypothetical protein HY298_18265 [Verrucomicrobia bacterium]|nr:hypothetical protein [Verrucomicrobiota bacterium]